MSTLPVREYQAEIARNSYNHFCCSLPVHNLIFNTIDIIMECIFIKVSDKFSFVLIKVSW